MLVFIDESGYAQPKDRNTWWTLTAVCVPEEASRDLSRRLHGTVRAVYPNIDPNTYEVKAAALLNRRQYERSAERRRLVAGLTQLIEDMPMAVFSVRGPRPTITPKWPKNRVDPPHRLLIERVELYARSLSSTTLAKLIFDETDMGNDALTSRALRTFIHATPEGQCWTHILDFPFFVSSAITPGIQLADFMAGAIRHYQQNRDAKPTKRTDWHTAITRLQRLAAKKSGDFKVGTATYYGLYTMPDRYYAKAPGPMPF